MCKNQVTAFTSADSFHGYLHFGIATGLYDARYGNCSTALIYIFTTRRVPGYPVSYPVGRKIVSVRPRMVSLSQTIIIERGTYVSCDGKTSALRKLVLSTISWLTADMFAGPISLILFNPAYQLPGPTEYSPSKTERTGPKPIHRCIKPMDSAMYNRATQQNQITPVPVMLK